MDEQFPEDNKHTTVTTDAKLGLGVKVLLTVIVVGAVAGGIYAAITLAK